MKRQSGPQRSEAATRRKMLSRLISTGLAAGVGGYALSQLINKAYPITVSPTTIEQGSLVSEASYIIFQDDSDSKYKVKNGGTGAIVYSSTSAYDVFNYAIKNLPIPPGYSGRAGRIYVKAGYYPISQTISVSQTADNVHSFDLVGENNIFTQLRPTGNFRLLSIDALYNVKIENLGFWVDANLAPSYGAELIYMVNTSWSSIVGNHFGRARALHTDYCEEINIHHNFFENCQGYAIWTWTSTAEQGRNEISNNIFTRGDLGNYDATLVRGYYVNVFANRIYGANTGVRIYSGSAEDTYHNVIDNIIRTVDGGMGIKIDLVGRNIICNNNLLGTGVNDTGIAESSTADNNIIINNIIKNYATKVVKVGANTVVKYNKGYITENSGAETIAAGSTYVDVSHGLAITPDINKIKVTPKDNLGGRSFWISDVGATTFRINISSTDTVNHAFGWSYE